MVCLELQIELGQDQSTAFRMRVEPFCDHSQGILSRITTEDLYELSVIKKSRTWLPL
ncbi:unnamed protein product, partial [Dicrocoelium dendriticum]